MDILVVGAGSVGMLLAAEMAYSGHAVTVVTRSRTQAEYIHSEGLSVYELDDSLLQANVKTMAYEEVRDQRGATQQQVDYHLVILAVKQHHLHDELITFVKSQMSRYTMLLCFMNGIGHIERIASVMPEHLIYTAVTTEGALKLGASSVRHTGKGITWIGTTFLNETVNRLEVVQIENLCLEAFKEAGFHAWLSNAIYNKVYQKLLINAVINPLTAVLHLRNGQLLESEHALQLMKSLYEEAVDLMINLAVDLDGGEWERIVEVCKQTASNYSSMLQDIQAGRKTELEWINGRLIRLGEERGMLLPTHRALFHILKLVEMRSR